MSNDPLAPYRRPAAAGPSAGGSESEREPYVAFGTKDHAQRLCIHCKDISHAPSYTILHNVVFDGPAGTSFSLVYGMMVVMVRGRNLQKVNFAIRHGQADFIQKFDPARWAMPKDASAAFIDSIEVTITQGGDSAPTAA